MTDRTERLLAYAVHNRTMRGVDRLFEAMDKHQARIEEDESLPSHVKIQIRDLYAMNQILYREVKRLVSNAKK